MSRRVFGAFVLCLGLLIPAAGRAQQATGKTVVLKAARMFDGKSNALVTPGVVVVTDGKIVAAGPVLRLPRGPNPRPRCDDLKEDVEARRQPAHAD